MILSTYVTLVLFYGYVFDRFQNFFCTSYDRYNLNTDQGIRRNISPTLGFETLTILLGYLFDIS